MPANPLHTVLCPHCNVHAQVASTDHDCPHCGGSFATGANVSRTNALIHRSHPAGALLLGALMAACSAPGTTTTPDAEVNEPAGASSGSDSQEPTSEPAEEPAEESGTPTPEAGADGSNPDPGPPVLMYGMPPSMQEQMPDEPAYGLPPMDDPAPVAPPYGAVPVEVPGTDEEGSATDGSGENDESEVTPGQGPPQRGPVPVPVYGMPPGFR